MSCDTKLDRVQPKTDRYSAISSSVYLELQRVGLLSLVLRDLSQIYQLSKSFQVFLKRISSIFQSFYTNLYKSQTSPDIVTIFIVKMKPKSKKPKEYKMQQLHLHVELFKSGKIRMVPTCLFAIY